LNYFTIVEQFFLSLKGSGLALSASDYQLIEEWEEQNIPIKVICRAIESAYSKIDTQITNRSSKTSLTQIKEIIEQEIREEIHKK
jgi:hypothetical protein|tara:strand:+ start:122 stop:376 length:255 start_codon:yes stop_codon:yes gene_type:complete